MDASSAAESFGNVGIILSQFPLLFSFWYRAPYVVGRVDVRHSFTICWRYIAFGVRALMMVSDAGDGLSSALSQGAFSRDEVFRCLEGSSPFPLTFEFVLVFLVF